jgi:hypothetical protein
MELTAPYNILLFLVLICVLYFEKLPTEIKTIFNGFFGKSLFIIILLGLLLKNHIVLSIMITIYYFRSLSIHTLESFVPGGVTNHHIIEGKNRWFIERLMQEKPYMIEDSIITTEAVQ